MKQHFCPFLSSINLIEWVYFLLIPCCEYPKDFKVPNKLVVVTCSSFRSPKEIPPDISTVAVSGTRNTFHPKLSKNVASWAWPVVLPPQGPPVRTNWKNKENKKFESNRIKHKPHVTLESCFVASNM